MDQYLLFKHLHTTLAAISILGFLFRGALVLKDSPWMKGKFLRVAPHVVDTLFLLSGIILAVIIGQFPGPNGWLAAKLIGLVVYIVLGTFALKRAPTKKSKAVFMLAAVLTFIWIIGIALNRHPLAWLA
jgi:uncharacterized membrane protein SirB2